MVPPNTVDGFDGPLIGDRYRLGPLLGEGGQGSTHKAIEVEVGREVAIKMFDLRRASGWKDLELFRRECQALRGLDHPGIPDYHDEIESKDGARAYLVMELVPGRNLRDRVREAGPLTEAELWNVLEQVLDILIDLQARQPPIIHRDIKPSNLIQRPDGRLVLVDFGGVRLRFRPHGGSTVVGTLGYMAPEQLYGQATRATDLYSLGATLVALASGCEPEELPRRGLQLDVGAALSVSDNFARILEWMVEPDPADRPASAQELLDTVRDVRRKEAAETPPSEDRPSPSDAEPGDSILRPELGPDDDAGPVEEARWSPPARPRGRAAAPWPIPPRWLSRRPARILPALVVLAVVLGFAVRARVGLLLMLVAGPILLAFLIALLWLLSPRSLRQLLRTPRLRTRRLMPPPGRPTRGPRIRRPKRGRTSSRDGRPPSHHAVHHQQRHRHRRDRTPPTE